MGGNVPTTSRPVSPEASAGEACGDSPGPDNSVVSLCPAELRHLSESL